MDRFDQEVEADFAHWYPGEDPYRLWAERRWRRLMNLVDRLPRSSHYVEAISQDEAMAQAWLDIPEEQRPEHRVRLTEYDPVLSAIDDRLAEVVTVLINVNSPRGGQKPNYADKPETAIQRLEAERARDLVHEVLGGWMS